MGVEFRRPAELLGVTKRKETGCGNVYVTIGYLEKGKPLEVLVRLGKSGGCASCQNEALGRVISIGLQGGIPADKFIHTLLGCRCPSPGAFVSGPKDMIWSCDDAVGRVLREFISDENPKST